MANPQPTDAHLRVAHSINEAIMTRDFTKRQRKILDLILRLSWGCGKKDAYIPYQRDFSVVGVHEVDIKGELDWLAVSKVIAREGSFYWFNKDFEQWGVSRVKPYQPKKLSELLRLNLNGNRPELSKTLSRNLVKRLVPTKQNAKFPTPNLALPKESMKERRKKENTFENKNTNSISSNEETCHHFWDRVDGALVCVNCGKRRETEKAPGPPEPRKITADDLIPLECLKGTRRGKSAGEVLGKIKKDIETSQEARKQASDAVKSKSRGRKV